MVTKQFFTSKPIAFPNISNSFRTRYMSGEEGKKESCCDTLRTWHLHTRAIPVNSVDWTPPRLLCWDGPWLRCRQVSEDCTAWPHPTDRHHQGFFLLSLLLNGIRGPDSTLHYPRLFPDQSQCTYTEKLTCCVYPCHKFWHDAVQHPSA